jgi:hypothetical protein
MDRHGLRKVVIIHVLERSDLDYSRIVDQDIDSFHLTDDRCNASPDFVFLGYITFKQLHLSSGGFQFPARFSEQLLPARE